MSTEKLLPANASKIDIDDLNPIKDKLDMRGLNYKQRRFCMLYVGNPIAAAEEAGYCRNYKHKAHKKAALSKVVFRLMQNEKVHRNIVLMQKQMEAFGILSVAEAKSIISDLARTSENERLRLDACKLALQWEGQLNQEAINNLNFKQENITVSWMESESSDPIEIRLPGQRDVDKEEKVTVKWLADSKLHD